MNKFKLFASIVLLVIALPVFSQAPSVTDFFNLKSRAITYFGVDFSRAKYNDPDFQSAQQIKDTYIPQWTSLMKGESKYFPNESFRKKNITNDWAVIDKVNSQANPTGFLGVSTYFSVSDVVEIVNSYNFETRTGLGIIFIVESFDRSQEKAIIDVVLFDIATKKVLLLEPMRGTPGGSGLRNFWANTVANILKTIYESKYQEWEKK